MKKTLCLILILLLITGCNAEYSIEITNNSVNEKLNISGVSTTKFDNVYIPIDYEDNDYTVYESEVEGIDYYNINKKNKNVIIDYQFNHNSFSKSTLFNTCYENSVFTIDSYELLITTSDEFLCYNEYEDLDELTVIIKSNYKYLDSNADEINGNEYKWYINKDNKDNSQISLRLDTSESSNNPKTIQLNSMFVLFLIVIIVILTILYIIRKIGIYRNKI